VIHVFGPRFWLREAKQVPDMRFALFGMQLASFGRKRLSWKTIASGKLSLDNRFGRSLSSARPSSTAISGTSVRNPSVVEIDQPPAKGRTGNVAAN